MAQEWPSLLAQDSDPMKSNHRSVPVAWAKSIAPSIRAWIEIFSTKKGFLSSVPISFLAASPNCYWSRNCRRTMTDSPLPDPSSCTNFAHLFLSVACGLRRHEAVELSFSHIQQREDHWAIVKPTHTDLVCVSTVRGHGPHLGAGRRNCSGASFGALSGVADFRSWLNFENVAGLSRKCFSKVFIRVPLAGWSDRS